MNRGYEGASVPAGNPLEPAVATAELRGRIGRVVLAVLDPITSWFIRAEARVERWSHV